MFPLLFLFYCSLLSSLSNIFCHFLNMFSQMHHHLGWCAQLCPAVWPFWCQPPGTGRVWHGQPLTSHRGYFCSLPTTNTFPWTPTTLGNTEKSLCIFLITFLQVFIHMGKIPLSILFSRLNSFRFLSLSSDISDPLFCYSSSVLFTGLTPVYPWNPIYWTQNSIFVSSVLSKRQRFPSSVCWQDSA